MLLWILFGLAGLAKVASLVMDRLKADVDRAGSIDGDLTARFDADGNSISHDPR